MFIKYNEKLINLLLLHVSLREDSLLFHEEPFRSVAFSFKYRDAATASFAYGRIIHGILCKWGCVDVSPKSIAEIRERSESKQEEKV